MSKLIRCPYCNESYYMEKYSTITAMYSPMVFKDGKLISKDPNFSTTHCTCLNCHKDFSYSNKDEDNEGYNTEAIPTSL